MVSPKIILLSGCTKPNCIKISAICLKSQNHRISAQFSICLDVHRLNLKTLYLPILLLLTYSGLQAQPYYFRRYQVENGLSNNAVLCSLQDKKDFMWFGTKDGLNRFDGYAFKVYRHDADDPKTIGGSTIQCLAEDSNGLLWVGTENGIYTYNAATETFSALEKHPHKLIRSILFDERGRLWFISRLSLFRYDPETKTTVAYPPEKNFYVSAFCKTPSGELWLATADGYMAHYDSARDRFKKYPIFDQSPPVTAKWVENIYPTSDGHILIGTSDQGAKDFDIVKKTYKDLLSHAGDGSGIYARDFIAIDSNTLWVASESGIYICDRSGGKVLNLRKQYNDPYSLSDNAIYGFCKDREGGIWVYTYFGGLNYYPRQYATFEKFFHKVGENSISGNAVREIVPDNNGNLWIGTEDAGINKLNLATGKITNFKPNGLRTGIAYSNVHGLLADGKELWVGTFEHGVDVMDLRTEKVIRHYNISSRPNKLRSNFIYAVYKTRSGMLLLSTTKGLYRYNRQTDDFSHFPGIPDQLFYTHVIEDTSGTIWIGTVRDGIFYYNQATGKSGTFVNHRGNANSLVDNRINRLFEDHARNIWIATEAGLSRLEPATGRFTNYTIKNGLPANVIYGLLEDRQHQLWISSSKGLIKFNPKNGHIKNYTTADGLLSDQFNYNSCYQDSNGNMYFGSVKGMIRFNPSDFTTDTFRPPVYITGLQVNNRELMINSGDPTLDRSILMTEKIVLNHTQSSFSIDFAALSYTSPAMTEYAYRMDGIDKEWTYLKQNRKAYFTDLSPGKYTFRVKASNSSGVWNTKETTMQIDILSPWWASGPAYALYTFLAGLILFLLVKRDHKRIERRNARRMEVFENEKEKEIYHAKIEFFTNIAHEIRTPLTLIRAPMEKLMKRAAEVPDMEKNLNVMNKHTGRLLELTNQLLDFRKTETKGFSLNFVKTNITEVLKDIASSFQLIAEQKGHRYQVHVPDAPVQAYIDLEAFYKIMGNLIDNAIKYGRSTVTVTLKKPARDADQLSITVASDGRPISEDLREKIFQPFFRARETEVQRGTGIGLSLARSLAELHNGSLIAEKNNTGFNIFVLTLPVHQLIEFNLNSKWKKT